MYMRFETFKIFLFFLFVFVACRNYGQGLNSDFISNVEGSAHPWTNLNFNNKSGNFHFAVISDLTGGYREGIFPEAVDKLNLLMPEFVISIGDLIEGYSKEKTEIDKWWDQFESRVSKLKVPFFYVPGNHDLTSPMQMKKWKQRFGPAYYYFIYKNILFLCLNTQDGSEGELGKAQVDYFKKVIAENKHVNWTFIFMHVPMWSEGKSNGFSKIEEFLKGRNYTVFAGHTHQYMKYKRNGMDYIVLGTTGGGSELRGPQVGEFDEVGWVTLTDGKPVISNLLLSGIKNDDILTEENSEAAAALFKASRISNTPIFVKGDEFKNGKTKIIFKNPGDLPLKVDASFIYNKYLRPDKDKIAITVLPKSEEESEIVFKNDRPVAIEKISPLRMRWIMSYVGNDIQVSGDYRIMPEAFLKCGRSANGVEVDGSLDDWPSFPFDCTEPGELGYVSESWHGPSDCMFKFNVSYDNSYLYIAAEVKDENLMIRPLREPWEQDGIEFIIDPAPLNEEIKSDKLEVYLNPAKKVNDTRLYGEEKLPAGLKKAAVITVNGYNAELAIPVSYLNKYQKQGWKNFRLNIAVFDHDNGESQYRGTQIFWMPDWSGSKNIAGSGTFKKY